MAAAPLFFLNLNHEMPSAAAVVDLRVRVTGWSGKRRQLAARPCRLTVW